MKGKSLETFTEEMHTALEGIVAVCRVNTLLSSLCDLCRHKLNSSVIKCYTFPFGVIPALDYLGLINQIIL